jgi:modulator of FtsH protease
MFDAPLWRDYFVMVGGGGAALTGLVFVAMSLHLSDIASDPTHRHRARTILTALTTVFIRCGLVLMGGQTARAVGVEIFVVIVGVEVVVLRSLNQALRGSGAAQHGVLSRTLGYAACLIIEQTGAAILFFGHTWGLYAVGVGMMASFLFIVSGAWLLLVGVDSPARRPAP